MAMAEAEAWVIIPKVDAKATECVLDMRPLVLCKDCKHGSLYCTDVCGETKLIGCNRPGIGDVSEIHEWKWFCADGERRTE